MASHGRVWNFGDLKNHDKPQGRRKLKDESGVKEASRKAVLVAALALIGCGRGGAQSPVVTAPDSFLVELATSRGPMTVAVHRAWSPWGADRLYQLVKAGFYDEARFFRVVPGFVAQFGIPADPALAERLALRPLPDDPVRQTNARGTLSFANAGPMSRNAQLFFNLVDNPKLDTLRGPGFAPVGRIVDGLAALDSLTSEYGNAPSRFQDSIRVQGNAYLTRAWPKLDYIRTARVVREWR
jgi:peptidyl-prolyl cis-trans isomerase A (cyclophilin A)